MWQQRIRSVCPVCDRTIEGMFYEEDGRVLMRKSCPEHGEVRDVASSDPFLFKGKMAIAPAESSAGCTLEFCGGGVADCPMHVGRLSPISFIEVTPRCNLACPVCYIDASTKGRDLPLDDFKRMVRQMKADNPETHLILIGGEPTIHHQFFEMLDVVRDAGLMKRCYVATNGVKLSDEEFCRKVRATGLRWFYLAFDGTDKEICRKIRGSYRSYEAPRKTIENLRKIHGSRVVLSVTVVKDVNDRDLPRIVDFALDNGDVVRRISISAEAYCGRQTSTEDLLRRRVTVECIENVLRRGLKIGAATLSFALYGVMLKPLKLAGVIVSGAWVHTVPHPLCGGVGMVGRNPGGSCSSIIDMAIRDPARNLYRYGKRFDDLGKAMEQKHERLSRSSAGRIQWKLMCWFYYLPKYLLMLLAGLRPSFLLRVLCAAVKSVVMRKKLRDVLFAKPHVQLHYLFACDKYNFVWDRMPFCLTHHYRLDPETGKVVKMCGCFVVPFRNYADSCSTLG
ncbi:MAG: radical SAM protein [Verrucomicrobiae bacterium]|nr:radical SAM protein [Verrucomicrobiae bacterium]